MDGTVLEGLEIIGAIVEGLEVIGAVVGATVEGLYVGAFVRTGVY